MLRTFYRKDRIYRIFRRVNVAIFLAVLTVTFALLLYMLHKIADIVARDYAALYSGQTIGRINTDLGRDIALVRKVANSPDVKSWLADEENPEKKAEAYEEIMGIIYVLPGRDLYVGVEKSAHEMLIRPGVSIDDIEPHATLAIDKAASAWYFETTASDQEYRFKVGRDPVLRSKRVWMNYKVTENDVVLGVLSTGLELSALVEDLFSGYDHRKVRGLIFDKEGYIHMDSASLSNADYSARSGRKGALHLVEEITDESLLAELNAYAAAIDGYFDSRGEASPVITLRAGGAYSYATIAPIASTEWSVLTLYNSSALFSITTFMPIVLTTFAALIIFIGANSLMSSKLVFVPLETLMDSIVRTKNNIAGRVYGTDRPDEIGVIANTVQNMRDALADALSKAHYDALTGIYNRRFLEENLSRIVRSAARAGGTLSVIMVDIDFFKRYNDTYGHLQGDACLKKIAAVLSGGVRRADDFVARYGGEEFAVILPNTSENGARRVADKLLEGVRSCNMLHETSDAASHVTISLGVTTGEAGHTLSGKDYIQRADEALYLSKSGGRNKYTFLKLYH